MAENYLTRLFGGGSSEPTTPTGQVAEATGATASSPFLQYLQNNAGAAKSTAAELLGPAPKSDNSLAMAMLGLSILGEQPGGAPLGVVARGASKGLPYLMKEKEKEEQYQNQVRQLAMQLGMKDFEVMQKLNEPGEDLDELGGVVYSKRRYKQAVAEGQGPKEALDDATVFVKSGDDQKDAEAYADTKAKLQQLQYQGNADPAELQRLQDQLQVYEWKFKPEPPSQSPVTVMVQGEDGKFTTLQGQPGQIEDAYIAIGDEKEARRLETKQRATDQTLNYISRTLDILETADTAAAGKAGGMASSISAWSKAIEEKLAGPRAAQFRSEVGDSPTQYLDKLMKDPEAENYMPPGLYEKLSEIGQDNARLLSNIIGLGYATARASDEGGRLSNSDVAFSLQRIGYDLDAFLNDPAAVRAGILELGRSAVSDYEGSLVLKPKGKELVERDYLLNERLKEYGFEWTGGPKGVLKYPGGKQESQYSGKGQADATGQQQQPPAGVTAQPVEYQGETPVYNASDLTPEQAKKLPSGTLIKTPDGKLKRIP